MGNDISYHTYGILKRVCISQLIAATLSLAVANELGYEPQNQADCEGEHTYRYIPALTHMYS
jgi:hypothetical protein